MSKINEVLQQGGVIAYVTDTVWGVGCLPDNEEAVKKIYEIKHRDGKKPLILMSDEVYNLFDYLRQPIEKEAQKLIKKHFPGALTLVLEKSEKTPDYITSGMQTVGIRIPDNETFAEICRNIDGRVLATTSANLSGEAPACKASPLASAPSLCSATSLVAHAAQLNNSIHINIKLIHFFIFLPSFFNLSLLCLPNTFKAQSLRLINPRLPLLRV